VVTHNPHLPSTYSNIPLKAFVEETRFRKGGTSGSHGAVSFWNTVKSSVNIGGGMGGGSKAAPKAKKFILDFTGKIRRRVTAEQRSNMFDEIQFPKYSSLRSASHFSSFLNLYYFLSLPSLSQAPRCFKCSSKTGFGRLTGMWRCSSSID
jgi:hypothetical protein